MFKELKGERFFFWCLVLCLFVGGNGLSPQLPIHSTHWSLQIHQSQCFQSFLWNNCTHSAGSSTFTALPMTWASTALLCSPWCWDVSSLSHSLTILQMQVSHFQIRVCIICTLTLLDFIGCNKVAFPFLSYKILHRLPKFCWMNTSSQKCNITVNFPSCLKSIIFHDRPLTVTRLRIMNFVMDSKLSSQVKLGSTVPAQEACVRALWDNGRSCLPDVCTFCPVPKER